MNEVLFEELSYLGADGQSRIRGYIWAPAEGKPRAIIQLAHGMCEYVMRYEQWARRFVERGYVFCGNDHIGHGQSAANKKELGYTAKKGGADYMVEDLHTMSDLVRERFPNTPLVLYGHSMGSFAARVYLTRYGEELSAALISGTAGPGNPTGLGLKLVKTLGVTRGWHYRSAFLTAMAFGSYNKHFKKEKDTFSWLTRDEQTRKAYAKDPYCLYVFTVAGFDTLFHLLGAISHKKWADVVPKPLPVLLFSGDMDPVGNYGKGVQKVYDRMIAAGCNATLKLYPNGRHEMHNECNKDEVFEDLIAYLEENLT